MGYDGATENTCTNDLKIQLNKKSPNKPFVKVKYPYIGFLYPKTCTQKVNQVHSI
jgi:hypothetical protein